MATTDTSVAGIDRWCPAGRRLHLIDADNLAGSGYPTVAEVREVHDAYRAAVAPGPLDHTIIACSHMAGVSVGLEWSGAQLLWRSGPDGADLALLDAVEHIGDVSRRFAGVVLGSGDGIFSPVIGSIRGTGMPVTVVWGRGSLSRHLEHAASQTLQIFSPTTAPAPCSRPRHQKSRVRQPQPAMA
jgi:hypothetical protein